MIERLNRVLARPDRLRIAALVRVARLLGIPIPVWVELIDGQMMKVLLPEIVSTHIAYDGCYEPEVTEMISLGLRHGGDFLDVGAHFGVQSMFAARMRGVTRVVAFEPVDVSHEYLKVNTSGIKCIETHKLAVGSCVGSGEIGVLPVEYLASSSMGVPKLPRMLLRNLVTTKQTVQVTSIDDFCQRAQIKAACIKVDAEGGGQEVVRGSIRVIERFKPVFILETGGQDGVKLLGDYGYRVEMKVGKNVLMV
jgi:FkbM family methyltransferase